MTKRKDTITINRLIIELAKANNWLSRNDLKERTGKPIKTLKMYLDNDLINLIELQDFTEYVKRNTGQGKALITKYKLKNGLDNLLAVFRYLKDKKYQKELMATDYYKSLIPEIESKLSGHIDYIPKKYDTLLELKCGNNEPDYILQPIPAYKSKEKCLNKLLNLSPSAALNILETIKDMEVMYPKYCIHLHELDRLVLNDISDGIIKGSEYQNDDQGWL